MSDSPAPAGRFHVTGFAAALSLREICAASV
jgi:hypothetical protein